MHLLFPGRHHLLTEFQFKYLFRILHAPESVVDLHGEALPKGHVFDSIIFAVTSANHSGTKRNPLPFHLRAMMVQDFCRDLDVDSYVYGIQDVGHLEDFAQYTLKSIAHDSNQALRLTPDNTWVICSTPVLRMYARCGFRILPAELESQEPQRYATPLPWEYVKEIAQAPSWRASPAIIEGIHASSFRLWNTYALGQKVKQILEDPIIGDDGDITESRDYGSYVRNMDEIAQLKYRATSPFIRPGNIGDIGCAVGSWIKLACEDRRFVESDFYGIELARQLFDICQQRKHNGEFANPSVFFAMKNAVQDLVFAPNSMDTIHCSSLTHEIESYGSRQELLDFIANRFQELKPGGVWINRDVIGPEDGDATVYLRCNTEDGESGDPYASFEDREALADFLQGLSTHARFLRFARDFRSQEGEQLSYALHHHQGAPLIELSARHAAEFLLTKDYTDNWESEMHETFCFWSASDWIQALQRAGFRLRRESGAYQNPWILENRWLGKVELFSDKDAQQRREFPPTNMLMIAEKL